MNITQGLHRAVAHTPDMAATIAGERTRTWRESARRVARLAGALRALGLHTGDRAAMLSLNSDRYHEYLLAVPWAGGVLNPVNTRWSAPEIGFSLLDSRTRILFVGEDFAPMLDELSADVKLAHVIYCGDGPAPAGTHHFEELVDAHPGVPDAYRHGDDLAGIFYTGGTTGTPKGVMLSHRAMLTSALGFAASGDCVTPSGMFLHAAPLFHLAAIGGWLVRNSLGGTHVTIPSFAPQAVIEAIGWNRVTDVLLVPTMLQMLVDSPHASRGGLASVKHLIYGASPISETLLERVADLMPTAELIQAYGMTELSPVATVLTGPDHLDRSLRRSAGRAAPHAQIQIVGEDGEPVPNGVTGEVIVRGGNVMLGYWERPEETTAVLQDGWMHTGDAGYLDERGYLFIVDRLKDMIVSGGENVYSAEVENVLAQHPAVSMCAVIGVPAEGWGESVHAVVVLHPGSATTFEELRDHCRKAIAAYKVPRSVDFVDSLPISGAGKVLKRALRERYWSAAERAVN